MAAMMPMSTPWPGFLGGGGGGAAAAAAADLPPKPA